MQIGPNRLDRTVQYVRNLPVVELLDTSQHNDGSLPRREKLDRVLHACVLVGLGYSIGIHVPPRACQAPSSNTLKPPAHGPLLIEPHPDHRAPGIGRVLDAIRLL
jgi:hypothetical protein